MIGGSLPPTKREATTTQFISAGHRDALAILCKPHNEYGLSNAAKLADKMWSLVSKDTQGRLLKGVGGIAWTNTTQNVLCSTWTSIQALRALRKFLDEAYVQLQLKAKNCVSITLSDAKGAAKELKLIMLQVEACRITANACADMITGDVSNQSVSALLEMSLLWSESLARVLEDAMYAMSSLAWDGGYDTKLVKSAMREHFRQRVDESRGALITETAPWGADVFLLPGHRTPLFLWKLAKSGLIPCGTYPCASASIDSRGLDDFRAVRAGVGVTLMRASWSGPQWRPKEVCFERCELSDSGGTKRQRVFISGSSQELLSFLKEGERDVETTPALGSRQDEAIVRTQLASHIWTGDRVPVAASMFVRHRFVCEEAVICVDSNITFGPLSGDWGQFVDRFVGDVTSRADCIRYPHSVVSVTLTKDRVLPPSLRKLISERRKEWGLGYAPSFSLDMASIACCFGDEKFHLSPYLEKSVAERIAEIKSQEQLYKQVAKHKLDAEDLGATAEEIEANRIGFMGRLSRDDPKTFLTSERTALTWVQTAIVFGTNSIALLALNTLPTRIGGLILILCAVICALYALFRWNWRRSSLERGSNLAAFQDQLGPFIVALIMIFIMTSQLVISNLTGYL